MSKIFTDSSKIRNISPILRQNLTLGDMIHNNLTRQKVGELAFKMIDEADGLTMCVLTNLQ